MRTVFNPSQCSEGNATHSPSLWRHLLLQLGIALGYLLLARIVHSYFASNIASVLWPSSGLALAVLLLGGKRYVWGVFLGALLTHILSDPSLVTPFFVALGNTLEALAGWWLLTRTKSFDTQLHSLRDYSRLILLGGCAASIVGASIGPAVLLVAGIFTPHNYLSNMLHWWMGDVLGVVLIAPLILVWRHVPRACFEVELVAETAVLFVLAFLAGQILFMGWFSALLGEYAREFWMFLFVAWAAVRMGMHGVLLLLLMVASQALLGAYLHVGLFGNDLLQTELLHFWLYVVSLSVVGILLAGYIGSVHRSKNALREQEEFFRLIAENVDDYIAVLDRYGQRLYNSPSYARMFGEVSALSTTDSFAEIHAEDRERIRQVFAETVATGIGQRAEFRFVLLDGSVRVMESRGGVIRDKAGQVLRVVVVSHDVTERKEADEKIHRLAFYDTLTQLPNRRLLNDRLGQAMSASKRSGRFSALIFLDLDNFKPLNDTHGHVMGDVLLVEASRRLAACVREVDTVARFGGDEFVVILNELDTNKGKSAHEARCVTEKIAAVLAQPYQLKYQAKGQMDLTVIHHCTSSIGAILFINHEHSQDELLKWADMTMYQAKNNGRNQICFPESCAASNADGRVIASLCHAKFCPRLAS